MSAMSIPTGFFSTPYSLSHLRTSSATRSTLPVSAGIAPRMEPTAGKTLSAIQGQAIFLAGVAGSKRRGSPPLGRMQ